MTIHRVKNQTKNYLFKKIYLKMDEKYCGVKIRAVQPGQGSFV